MKANWKFALMGLAALALIACNKNEPKVGTLTLDKEDVSLPVGETVQLTANMDVTWASSNDAVATVDAGLVTAIAAGEANIIATAGDQNAVCKVTVTGSVYEALVDVEDNSIAEWDLLPADYLFAASCPEDASLLGLKSVKVFADEMYIFILMEPNMDDITDLAWVPFHVYLDADNSDETGGYGDEFTDPNSEWLCETVVFADGAAYSYNPAVFKWWGNVGENGWLWTDPSVEHSADDGWGAIIAEGALPVGQSQYVDGKFEMRLMKELISSQFGETFGIGFDIQQNWSSVGVLPISSPSEENPNGFTNKLKVKVYFGE